MCSKESIMKARIVTTLTLIGLFSVCSAYAMTDMQAKQIAMATYNGNAEDLVRLEAAAKSGDAAWPGPQSVDWTGSSPG